MTTIKENPLVMMNGNFQDPKNLHISVLSESFIYGYGVFETLRTYNKKVFQAKEHLERLKKAATAIGIKISFTYQEIEKQLIQISEKSPHQDQRIKIIVIKEGLIIISSQLIIDPDIYKRGVSCQSTVCQRSMPEIKSISYLSSYLQHEKAVKNQKYESIFIDKNKEVYEGAYSNVFWFEEDTLYTREKDVLEGITRNTVLNISPYKTEFKNIGIEELKGKKEVFLTQSSTGIVPVVQIDETIIGEKKPGKRTEKLIEIFRQLTIT